MTLHDKSGDIMNYNEAINTERSLQTFEEDEPDVEFKRK